MMPMWLIALIDALEKEEDKQASYAAEEAETKGGYYAEDYSF